MNLPTSTLPTDQTKLCEAIESHVTRERSRLAYTRAMWLLAYYYLCGARRFDVFDVNGGFVNAHYVDKEGKLPFQCTELIRAIDQNASRLASADLRPWVQRADTSLNGIRERATGQVLADTVIQHDPLRHLSISYASTLVSLGCAGLETHTYDDPVHGLVADIEVVHPRELFPFPSLGQDIHKLQGIIRSRLVPLDWLRNRYGNRKVNSNLQKIRWFSQAPGEATDLDIDTNEGVGGQTRSIGYKGVGDGDTGEIGWARINELRLYGPNRTLARYVVTSGDYVFEDVDYQAQGLIAYPTLSVGRYMENGTFHGAGLFHLLFSYNREMEKMLESLFTNIRDIDRFGFLVMPRGSFNKSESLREVGRGLRVLSYEPDTNLTDTNFRPFAVQPFNSGDIPGRTAAFAKTLFDGLNPIRDLIEEKGRVDSANGLAFLDEQINKAMTTASQHQERVYSEVYRATVANVASIISRKPRAIPLGRLTVDMAGLVIDPDTQTISFKENPLPDLSRLKFGIRDPHPRSDIAKKQAALERVQQGLSDPMRFYAHCIKHGIEPDIWIDDYEGCHTTIVTQILRLYNDGQSPGVVILTPYTARPEYQLMILNAFMSSPTMEVASADVQAEFKRFRTTLMMFMGLTLPAAVPNPEDVAALQPPMAAAQSAPQPQF